MRSLFGASNRRVFFSALLTSPAAAATSIWAKKRQDNWTKNDGINWALNLARNWREGEGEQWRSVHNSKSEGEGGGLGCRVDFVMA